MSTTQHTGHYNLPTFGDNPNDRPSWRGDFTDAMTKIDNQMYANATNTTAAQNTANDAKTAAQTAQNTADTANNTAEIAQTTAITAQNTANDAKAAAQTAQTMAVTSNNAAEAAQTTADSNTTAISNINDSLEKSWNAVHLGVNNTGTSDASQKINEILNTEGCPGLYFPNGHYRLDSPITCKAFQSITADNGAWFEASAAIGYLVKINDGDRGDNIGVTTSISGGIWDGASKASNGIVVAGSGNRNYVSNLSVIQCTGTHIYAEAHATVINDVIIDSRGIVGSTGVKLTYDCQVGNAKIFQCTTGIKSELFNQLTNVYIWGGGGTFQASTQTVGIDCGSNNGTIQVSNVYLDSCQRGINGSGSGRLYILGNGLFFYYNNNDTPVSTVPNVYMFNISVTSYMLVKDVFCHPTRSSGIWFSSNDFESIVDINPKNITNIEDAHRLNSSANIASRNVPIRVTDLKITLTKGKSYLLAYIDDEFNPQQYIHVRNYAGDVDFFAKVGKYASNSRLINMDNYFGTSYTVSIDQSPTEGRRRIWLNWIGTNIPNTHLFVSFASLYGFSDNFKLYSKGVENPVDTSTLTTSTVNRVSFS